MPTQTYYSPHSTLKNPDLADHWRSHKPPPPANGTNFVTSVLNSGISVELFKSPTVAPAIAEDRADQELRFAGHLEERVYWLKVLPKTKVTRKNLENYRDCGKNAWIEHSESRSAYRIKSKTCGMRICPVCGDRRRSQVKERLVNAFALLPRAYLRFVTLTLRSTSAPLSEQLDRLTRSFRRLRQRKLWQDKVTFGAGTIELTRSNKTGNWHPHLHILYVGEYIDQGALSRTWKAITGDSMIVDIRKVDSTTNAILELAKYASKPLKFGYLKDDVLAGVELFNTLAGRHLLIVFGDAPDHLRRKPKKKKTQEGIDDWCAVMPLWVCIDLAQNGNQDARKLLQWLDNPMIEQLKLPRGSP